MRLAVLYEKCAEVSGEFWQELGQLPPADVTRRTGVAFQGDRYRLPFLNRRLIIDPAMHRLEVEEAGGPEPDFRLCLTAVLYLARVDTGALGTLLSPLELTGGATFFTAGPSRPAPRPLEKRFGDDPEGFLLAGDRLGAIRVQAGDAALQVQVFPGLAMEIILWLADAEFPAQVSFKVPGYLERRLASGRSPGPPATPERGTARRGRLMVTVPEPAIDGRTQPD